MSFLQQYDAAAGAAKLQLLFQWIATQPLALFAELRENRPILVTPGGPVLVTRFADVEEALSRNMVFTVRPYAPKMDPSVGPFMLARDGTVYNQRDKGIMRALIQQTDMPGVRKIISSAAKIMVLGRISFNVAFWARSSAFCIRRIRMASAWTVSASAMLVPNRSV